MIFNVLKCARQLGGLILLLGFTGACEKEHCSSLEEAEAYAPFVGRWSVEETVSTVIEDSLYYSNTDAYELIVEENGSGVERRDNDWTIQLALNPVANTVSIIYIIEANAMDTIQRQFSSLSYELVEVNSHSMVWLDVDSGVVGGKYQVANRELALQRID